MDTRTYHERFLIGGDCLVFLLPPRIEDAEIEPGLLVVRFMLGAVLNAGAALSPLFLAHVRQAEVVPGLGIGFAQLDRLSIACHGLGIFLPRDTDEADVEVRLGVVSLRRSRALRYSRSAPS